MTAPTAKQKALDAAQAAAEAFGGDRSSWRSFGAVAAWFGGVFGTKRALVINVSDRRIA